MQRKNDTELRQQVLREMKWDTRVSWGHINVKVTDGIVTLTGVVSNYAEKDAAERAAHRVAGVLDVANDLEVKVTNIRTDTEIARAVRSALEWDVLVPDDKIRSTVSNGWVTLEGEVNTLREKEDAERAVRHLMGVAGIIDRIEVAPLKVDPEELRLNIEDALERRAEREAERLRVEVSDGEIDLWGRVHSWQEKRAVLGSIIHAPGVNKVNDHLHVDPYF
jgi:osmotically-inducible protein OsmY